MAYGDLYHYSMDLFVSLIALYSPYMYLFVTSSVLCVCVCVCVFSSQQMQVWHLE